jgi:hypothetical protein
VPAALEFAHAEDELVAEFQVARDRGERRFADQARAETREFAFVGARKNFVQKFRDKKIDQPVAEEFQPLVVARADAAMAQRAFA